MESLVTRNYSYDEGTDMKYIKNVAHDDYCGTLTAPSTRLSVSP